MHLFVSDLHFGKSDKESERRKEQDFLDLIAFVSNDLDALFLLGDVFDQYIEYRHLVPKGFVRLQAAVGQLVESGTPVTYIVGNHDPWHLDYFRDELGVAVHSGPTAVTFGERRLYVAHGDRLGERASERLIKRITRGAVAGWLYRTFLPADTGFRFARWVKRRWEEDEPEQATVDHLRKHARALLFNDFDAVILGHSHVPEHLHTNEGEYINTGSWHHGRTFALADHAGIRLGRWDGRSIVEGTASGAPFNR